jgi:hypothetical protein
VGTAAFASRFLRMDMFGFVTLGVIVVIGILLSIDL